MLLFLTGVPGSGKTYKAVKHIYDHFGLKSKKKSDSYLFCYNNITNFDFTMVDKCVLPFDFDDFKSKLTILYDFYKHKKYNDKQLIEEAKKLRLYKCLFVIDEAHNFFQTKDDILVWWLTYHRHLYQDIFLITQNLSLIERKYKPLAEYFYRAVPSSLRLNKKIFKYNVFIDSRMTKASKAKTEKIKFNPDVIKLYHSGDVVKSPNFILRFLIFSVSLFIVLSLVFYFYQKSYLDNSSNSNNVKHFSNNSNNHNKNPHSDIPKKKYNKAVIEDDISDCQFFYQLQCFKLKCIVNNQFTVSYFFIKTLPQISDSKIFYEISTSYGKIVYLATNLDLSKFNPNQNAYGGKKDEKDSVLPFNSGK